MDIEIKKDNQAAFRLKSKQIYVQDVNIQSITQEATYSESESRMGRLFNGTVDRYRTITVPFFIYEPTIFHFPLLRDELFALFGLDDFYLRELWSDQKTDLQKVSGKQYRVRLKDVIELSQSYKFGQGSLVFETTDLPYARSVMTTQEIQTNGISIDRDWSFGMGLETVDDSEIIYLHNAVVGKTFRVFNAGNVEIHPFEAHFKLTVKNVKGSSENFQISNLTNGSRMRINVPIKATDVWTYDGPNVTRNSLAAIKDTRKDFVSLAPGWNNFQIYFCDSAEVSFDFNFLYR